jgi:hypothetical protein
MKLSLIGVVVLGLVGCPSPPGGPKAPDASQWDGAVANPYLDAGLPGPSDPPQNPPSDVVTAACQNLTRMNCPEGCNGGPCGEAGSDSCYTNLQHRLGPPKLADDNLSCVAGVRDPVSLRSCSATWTHSCNGR